MVVGDSCGQFQSWGGVFKKECVGGLSQELTFRGVQRVWPLPGLAVTSTGRSGRGHRPEWCFLPEDPLQVVGSVEGEGPNDGFCAQLGPGTQQDCSVPSATSHT